MTEPTAAQPAVDYHWILTVQLPNGRILNVDGVITLTAPAARSDMLAWAKQELQDEVMERTGRRVSTLDMGVLFFDAQPNDIIPAGAR